MREKNSSQTLTLGEQATQAESEDSDLVALSSLPFRELKVPLSARKVTQFLLLVVISLCLLSMLGQFALYFLPSNPLVSTFARLFYVDTENNIPSLYSASALLFCSILLATIAYAKMGTRHRYVRQWQALSFIFLFLALDEAISIHELLSRTLRTALNTSGVFYFAWVIPGAIFVGICLVAFWKFLAHLPAKTRRLFILAGTVYVGGAMGIEIVGGAYTEVNGMYNMNYTLIATLEEFFEMLGVVVFIYALLSYISSSMKGLTVQVQIGEERRQQNIAEPAIARSPNY